MEISILTFLKKTIRAQSNKTYFRTSDISSVTIVMAELFVQYLPIYSLQNLPSSIENLP